MSWRCRHCSTILKLKLLDKTQAWFEEHRKTVPKHFRLRFLTLTLKVDNPGDIMAYWRRMWDLIRKKYPGIYGFLVKEHHKSGKAHLHVLLMSPYIPHAWLKASWRRITKDSFVVGIRAVTKVRKPAAYMLKYMNKQLDGEAFQRHERRYSFFGRKAPKAPEFEPDPEREPLTFTFARSFNPDSKYWAKWYNEDQAAYGPAYIAWMSRALLGDVESFNVLQAEIELGYHDQAPELQRPDTPADPFRRALKAHQAAWLQAKPTTPAFMRPGPGDARDQAPAHRRRAGKKDTRTFWAEFKDSRPLVHARRKKLNS